MELTNTTLLAPPDDEMSAAKSGKGYSKKVVSFHRLARTRGTPGSGIRPPEALLRMGMQSMVVLRADAAVLIDWIFTQEAAYSQLANLPIDARSDTMSFGWALFRGYVWSQHPCCETQFSAWRVSACSASACDSDIHRLAWTRGTPGPGSLSLTESFNMEPTGGANFTFWIHSSRSQRQEWHKLSWETLSDGRWSLPASRLFSGRHSVARARDPSLWYARYRLTLPELMGARALSLEHRLDYGGQL